MAGLETSIMSATFSSFTCAACCFLDLRWGKAFYLKSIGVNFEAKVKGIFLLLQRWLLSFSFIEYLALIPQLALLLLFMLLLLLLHAFNALLRFPEQLIPLLLL